MSLGSEAKAKRTGKDTVFADIFASAKYILRLVEAVHPEEDITASDIKWTTLKPVLLDQPYNDLSIMVKDRLLIFVEAQSTWSYNIPIRLLLYLAATYHQMISGEQAGQKPMNIYGSKRVPLPKPEFFVIFTGKRRHIPDTISLAEDFFQDASAPIDLKVKVWHQPGTGNIIAEYIRFCQALDAQVGKLGNTREAVERAIKICQEENVLSEYLETRQKEVVSIMMTLFSQEYAVDAYANERYEDGLEKGKLDIVKSLLSIGTVPIEAIQQATGWSKEQLDSLKG